MLQYAVLGFIQGILEWLPVSSEGFLVMASSLMGMPGSIDLALYLHLGTLISVLFYFRSKILSLLRDPSGQGVFIGKATVVSLLVAFPLYLGLKWVEGTAVQQAGSVLLALTGVALVVTGFLLRRKHSQVGGGYSTRDSLFAGFLQGLAVIPGLSRSGVTMFALLSRGYEPEDALETSFLMSVPVVLAANVFLHLTDFAFVPEYLVALVVAFVVGTLSIHFLLGLARRIDFSWFCWLFGVLCFSAFLVFF